MADEARLNAILDLVEQARAEGDSVTEQKAISAYRAESGPRQPWRQVRGAPAAQFSQQSAVPNYASAFAPQSNLAEIGGVLDAGVTSVANTIPSVTGAAAGLVAPFLGKSADEAERRFGVEGWGARPMTNAGLYAQRTIGENASNVFSPITKAAQKVDSVAGFPASADIRRFLTVAPVLMGAKSAYDSRPRPWNQTEIDVMKRGTVPPTKEALGSAASAAYKRAESAGVVAPAESMAALKSEVVRATKGIDPSLHPNATAALKRVTSHEGPASLEDIETLRRIAKDAQSSPSMSPADRRLAAVIEDAIDEHVDSPGSLTAIQGNASDAVAALKEARNLYSRNRKAQFIDDIMSRAEVRSGQFSVSGMENAVRTELRQVALNKRKLAMFTPEEQAAIREIAQGTKPINTLRNIGKMAPRNILSIAAMVPTMGVSGVAGELANQLAARLQMRKINHLSGMMRIGPPGSVQLPIE